MGRGVRIEPGQRLRQRITVTFEGNAPARPAGAANGVALRLGDTVAGRVPAIVATLASGGKEGKKGIAWLSRRGVGRYVSAVKL